jgi:hypothetical protein
MNRLVHATLVLAVFWSACTGDKAEWSNEKYMDLILDLQVAETLILNAKIENKDSLRRAYHQRICEIYQIPDIATLQKQLRPLEGNPEKMLEITKMMIKQLDRLADSALTNPAGIE